MEDGRRKLPSWMLGVKNNENNNDISNNNGCQKEEGNEKLVKGGRRGKMVIGKERKGDGDDDEFEPESSDVAKECNGGNRRIRRKGNVDDESREGKKKDRRIRGNVKGSLVDDMVDGGIGYGKRKNSAKARKEELGSDDNVYVDVDDDNGMAGEKRNKGGRKRKGEEKRDAAESKELESEEDDDGFGAQAVMRKCKGKRWADRGKLVDGTDLVDVRGSDDEDLTVEDLVSIAEEYVSEDMEAAQQLSLPQGVSNVGNLMIRKEQPIENEEIGENHTSETSIHDNTQPGGSFSSKLLDKEEARQHSLLNENVTVIKPVMSGDPTQDMLDLFLGHLLKKPQEEEQKLDAILAVQRQEPVDPPVVGVPFTKKKSSLKDKVAMFFD